MVTRPVSIPFIGRTVNDWARRVHSTVMGFRRETSPKMIGGFTQREP